MALEEFIEKIRPYTKSSRERVLSMIHALGRVDRGGIAGDVVECGVWRGGNILLARTFSPSRVCWLYDTFTGMTEPGDMDVKVRGGARALDLWGKNAHKTRVPIEDVRQNFLDWGFDHAQLRFVQGPVEETLLDVNNLPDRIALLRLDTDWYASTKVEMEVLYPRLVSGGVLIIDDYGHWQGAQQAVREYLGDGVRHLTPIDYTAVQMVKP